MRIDGEQVTFGICGKIRVNAGQAIERGKLMASSDYLDDSSYCPDCGQPTTTSWRTWGNTVCQSVSPKRKCQPLTARNFCGRCGKPDPGKSCEGCANPNRRWWQYEPSSNERWFWINFRLIECPLIAICCLFVGSILGWIHVAVLDAPIAELALSGVAVIPAGIATYGLFRLAFASRSRFSVSENHPGGAATAQQSNRAAEPLPVARIVQAPDLDSRLIACPDCERMISKRANSCPHCGCPSQHTVTE